MPKFRVQGIYKMTFFVDVDRVAGNFARILRHQSRHLVAATFIGVRAARMEVAT